MICLDGAIPDYIEAYVAGGVLPNIKKVMKRGSYARALSALPCDTPTNWTTIATGCWPGTHGVVSFYVHKPGERLTTVHETLNTDMCRAEFIWDVAEKAGMKPFLLTYPGAFPPTIKRGIAIRGMHGDYTFSPEQLSPPPSRRQTIDSPPLFVTGKIVEDQRNICRKLSFRTLKDSKDRGLPSSCLPIRVAQIPVCSFSSLEWGAVGWTKSIEMTAERKRQTWYLLLTARSKTGYDRVIISRDANGTEILAELRKDEWSRTFCETFIMEDGKREKGVFLFKLMELSDDGKDVKLYRSKIFKKTGWAFPRKIEKEIEQRVGTFIYGFEHGAGPIDLDLCLEHVAKQVSYYTKLTTYAAKEKGCDFLVVKVHVQDAFNHWLLNEFDRDWDLYDPRFASQAEEYYRRSYQQADRLVGNLVDALSDERTVTAVVSDHGAVPLIKRIDYRPLFVKRGLLAYKKRSGEYVVDLSRTQALMINDQVFVNLKGREMGGIVSKKDYEKVRDRIIAAFYSLTDPATSQCPVELACRKEDLEVFGVWGQQYGDVYVTVRPGYWLMGGEVAAHVPVRTDPSRAAVISKNSVRRYAAGGHFAFMPNARKGIASNMAFFMVSGPGVKRGFARQRPIRLVDVACTVCHLLDLPMPADNEGGAIVDFFE